MHRTIQAIADRARFIKRTLGTRSAAGFLRNRGATLQEALFTLTGNCIVRGGV